MIIEALLELIFTLFSALTSGIDLPDMPEGVSSVVEQILEYIEKGIKLVSNYIDMEYLLILFGAIISVDVGVFVYKLVMWIIRKIPISSE